TLFAGSIFRVDIACLTERFEGCVVCLMSTHSNRASAYTVTPSTSMSTYSGSATSNVARPLTDPFDRPCSTPPLRRRISTRAVVRFVAAGIPPETFRIEFAIIASRSMFYASFVSSVTLNAYFNCYEIIIHEDTLELLGLALKIFVRLLGLWALKASFDCILVFFHCLAPVVQRRALFEFNPPHPGCVRFLLLFPIRNPLSDHLPRRHRFGILSCVCDASVLRHLFRKTRPKVFLWLMRRRLPREQHVFLPTLVSNCARNFTAAKHVRHTMMSTSLPVSGFGSKSAVCPRITPPQSSHVPAVITFLRFLIAS